MFERFRNATAMADRPVEDRPVEGHPEAAAPTTRETVRDVRARQRAEYGGLNWGVAFFGWLVAVGMAAPCWSPRS